MKDHVTTKIPKTMFPILKELAIDFRGIANDDELSIAQLAAYQIEAYLANDGRVRAKKEFLKALFRIAILHTQNDYSSIQDEALRSRMARLKNGSGELMVWIAKLIGKTILDEKGNKVLVIKNLGYPDMQGI